MSNGSPSDETSESAVVRKAAYEILERNEKCVKLLTEMRKLKCEVNFGYNIAVEQCSAGFDGGFDHTNSQIVLCLNRNKDKKSLEHTLSKSVTFSFSLTSF